MLFFQDKYSFRDIWKWNYHWNVQYSNRYIMKIDTWLIFDSCVKPPVEQSNFIITIPLSHLVSTLFLLHRGFHTWLKKKFMLFFQGIILFGHIWEMWIYTHFQYIFIENWHMNSFWVMCEITCILKSLLISQWKGNINNKSFLVNREFHTWIKNKVVLFFSR